MRRLGDREGLPVWEGAFAPEPFLRGARGLETAPEGGPRCAICFRLRLEATAARAAAEGFDWFCTTLTVSPHKDAALVNRVGEEVGAAAGVPFLPADFKKRGGFLRSVELTRELGLYRQDYCGCRFSRGDRA